MLDQMTQLLKSPAAADLLKQLQGHGLSDQQASAALSATAEGVVEQTSGAGGLAGMAAGLMGGAGGGLGALGSLLGGGAGGDATSGMSAMAGPVAAFVAQKTGLAPAMAQTIVNAVLPKLMAMLSGAKA